MRALVAAHGVVDQHPLEGFDEFLERLALGGHRRRLSSSSLISSDAIVPEPRRFCSTARSAMLISWRTLPGQGACSSCAASCAVTCGRVAAVFLGELLGEAGEQHQDVLAALAQRRHGDAHRRQPVEQIGAQHAFAGLALVLQVADRHDPGFGRGALVVDRGQQPGLQRPAAAPRYLPAPACRRARLFDRGLGLVVLRPGRTGGGRACPRQRPHSTPARTSCGPRAHRMQRMGHQRLAGAGLAVDQHMAVGLAQIEDILRSRSITGEVPISLFISVEPSDSSRRSARLSSVRRRAWRGLLGQFGHPVGVERLFEEVDRRRSASPRPPSARRRGR